MAVVARASLPVISASRKTSSGALTWWLRGSQKQGEKANHKYTAILQLLLVPGLLISQWPKKTTKARKALGSRNKLKLLLGGTENYS